MRGIVSALFAEIRRRKVFQTFVPYLGFVWLILQIISVITPMFNLSLLFNTLVAVILFAGMPIMLYLSWYFDFTLDGLLPIPDAESEEVSPFGLSRWAILTFITLGSGFLAYRYFSTVQIEFAKANDGIQQTFIANSIAVLPFKDASADQDQAFIAQGLAEEITSLLARTNGLKVAASSSSSILADKSLDPVSIARRLQVDTVLTGSVRVTGDQLKIRAELINANDAKVLWSETFARKFNDIFAVESEIARSTVNMLQDTYIETGSLTNSANTKSTDAYVIYLKGREQYRKQTTESMKEARKLFEQAIGLDPEYAQAYVALADTIAMLAKGTDGIGHDAFFGVLDGEIASKLAEQNLEKALVRDSKLPEAYAVRGLLLGVLQDNYDNALSSLDKAISLNPNFAKAYMWKFLVFDKIGKYKEAWQILQQAYALDPISIANQSNRGFYLSQQGHIQEAETQYKLLVAEFPNSPLGYAGLASIEYNKANYSESVLRWKQAHSISPENTRYEKSYIGLLLEIGLVSEARKLSSDPMYLPNFLLLEGKDKELNDEMANRILANPDDPWIRFEAAFYQMLIGNNSAAEKLLIPLLTEFSDDELYNMPLCSPAIEIAWALLEKDNNKESQSILKKCELQLNNARQENITDAFGDYLAARLAVLNKNEKLALQELNKAFENGWRQWWTKYDPIIASVLETDTGKDIMIKIDDHLKKEREEVRQLNIF
jgi:TolB-like protein/Tfp pilus assembly protein PilF